MNKEENDIITRPPAKIPTIKAESETQTSGHLVILSQDKNKPENMETLPKQNISIKKRRNISKNRAQATRQREKTPEPGRMNIPHEDTTTSDDEDIKPPRSSREIEADKTYEEMKRLVSEKQNDKDPVYDLDIDEVLVARAAAANERRRRSISPFALPDKDEPIQLQRKGSFIDPTNKLLSTTYTLSPKDEDSGRRNSLPMEPSEQRASSLSPPTTSSPKDKVTFAYPSPNIPKNQDEVKHTSEVPKNMQEDIPKNKLVTPVKKDKEDVFTFEKKEEKPVKHSKPQNSKAPEQESGELVTKVIQIERTPSKKLGEENKPIVEVRQRVVRTPSRKVVGEMKPTIVKQPIKPNKEEVQSKGPPQKPARSKSATRGGKTSESEMSDQGKQQIIDAATTTKRKAIPTPRRFLRNRSPRGIRSQSANRTESMIDKTNTNLSQTSREILELMQQARARSLSIPKDDPRLPQEYKNYKNDKSLVTPNKTPVSRCSRGVSCPKTIQIISDKEILAGLTPIKKLDLETEKRTSRSSGYVDASQSEYTSSCYSTTPSENEYDFDLSERTAELTRKLNLLSQQVDARESNILLSRDTFETENNIIENLKPVPRKRVVDKKEVLKLEKPKEQIEETKKETSKPKKPVKPLKSKWKLFKICDNWRQFVKEQRKDYESIRLLRNRCVCDLLLLVILCGLGGMTFKALEGSFENAYKCSSRNVKRDFIESLWRGSHYMREEEWKSMARKKLYEFEDQLHTAHEAGVTSYSGQRSWNFMNSFVYCLTLVTTIGYGHISPKTTPGRAATIVYAIIGIPLFLIVLADFGKLFTRIIKFFWSFIRRFYYTRSCRKVRRTVPVQEVMKGLNIVYDAVRRPSQIFFEEEGEGEGKEEDRDESAPQLQRKPSVELPPPLPPKPGTVIVRDPEAETDPDTPAPSVFEIDDEFNLPISVAIFILIVYILIGAVGYNMWETWSFFESFYFVFISMSTIGLGDLVPDHPMFMMASILYLVFGLALTSMCINVVQVKLSDTFKKASAKLGATIGLKVAEEDGCLVPITPPPTELAPVHKPKKSEEKVEDKKESEQKETKDD